MSDKDRLLQELMNAKAAHAKLMKERDRLRDRSDAAFERFETAAEPCFEAEKAVKAANDALDDALYEEARE